MKPRLLVIDDESAIRDSLKMILEYEGYEVLTAPTGEDGIAQAEREAPDLIFLDVKMPGMDGLEVLQRLRHLVEATPVDSLVIELKFGKNRERVITDLKRVSKPGRRVYAKKDRLPRVLGGLGTAILSTSTGVITTRQAAERGVGGEVLAFVW